MIFACISAWAKATKVDKVEIRWPDGAKETCTLPGVDRYFAIEEGKGLVPSVYDAHRRRAGKGTVGYAHAR